VSVAGRIWEEKGCEYRTTPARLKGTAVLSPRGLGKIIQTNPSSWHETYFSQTFTAELGPLPRMLSDSLGTTNILKHLKFNTSNMNVRYAYATNSGFRRLVCRGGEQFVTEDYVSFGMGLALC